jgi:hypothetical protein
MTQCIDSLRLLVDEKIRLLKTNKYLANADWIFIERNFQIENRFLIHKEMNLIDENLQCVNCHRLFNQIEYDDLIEEIRIRIINIQKVKFLFK